MFFSTKRGLIVLLSLLALLFCFYKCTKLFAAGSYPFAECYELNYPENDVIKAIEIVKQKNPYLQNKMGFTDNDNSDYWHHEWFDLQNNLIMTWTRPSSQKSTTFALVSVLKSHMEWEDVNNDLGFLENRKIKKRFEEIILKKVEDELKSK